MKSREKQTSLILDTLYTRGPQSRIDLSKLLGITPATVSDITQELIHNQVLFELGEDTEQNTAGRRKILLDVLPKHSYYVGLELFTHSLSLCLTDNLNTVISEVIYEFDKNNPLSTQVIIDKLSEFLNQNESYKVESISFALPGHYDDINEVILTNNPFWSRISLSDLNANFKLPIYYENNVNCMAIQERYFGNSNVDPNFIYLHFRRGIFCTYFYRGEIYARNNFHVGEVGHMVVNPNGEQCECGKKGCLQTSISQTWLIHKATLLYEASSHTYLHALVTSKEDINLETILAAYNLGDTAIIEMLRVAIDSLAIMINNLTVTLDTYTIYIHSQLFNDSNLSTLLLERIEHFDSGFNMNKNIKKIINPYSKQDGARSACALGIEQTLMPREKRVDNTN